MAADQSLVGDSDSQILEASTSVNDDDVEASTVQSQEDFSENPRPQKQQKTSSSAKGGGGTDKPTSTSAEFEPPLACVRRVLKRSLPKETNFGRDASSAFTRAAGIFIIYVTACANDFARENKRQTITANDILSAIKELDFDEFSPQLEDFLTRHREDEKRKKDAKNKAKKEIDEQEGGDLQSPLKNPSNQLSTREIDGQSLEKKEQVMSEQVMSDQDAQEYVLGDSAYEFSERIQDKKRGLENE
mmetsp:Transcript_38297/g.89070  ORF Transcript_38297/g.89070 Transcript_38297/m.89070 type:complete len:245 (-) Transcript_38297:654-1388(-)